jgi:hypothetical protein
LVVEVEQNAAIILKWCTLSVTAPDTAVLAQRGPTSPEPVCQPDLVLNVLGIVREMVRSAVNQPAKVRKSFCHTAAEPSIQEELRLPG